MLEMVLSSFVCGIRDGSEDGRGWGGGSRFERRDACSRPDPAHRKVR